MKTITLLLYFGALLLGALMCTAYIVVALETKILSLTVGIYVSIVWLGCMIFIGTRLNKVHYIIDLETQLPTK